jgi:hypothetical protein
MLDPFFVKSPSLTMYISGVSSVGIMIVMLGILVSLLRNQILALNL